MTINMTRNPVTGTYEYKPEPKFRLKDLLTPGIFDILVVTAFLGYMLGSFFF